MATIETNPELGAEIVADAKEYVLYSWSVPSQLNPIAVAGAEGRHFWDYDGKRYLDFASQLVNVNIGHQHPKIIAAIKEQADQLCTIGPPMASESRSRLGRLLAEVTPGDLSVSFFTNGGAEANENAIKLARLATGRHKVIARYRSYHGATNGAVTLTGDPRRWAVEPGMPGVVRMFDRELLSEAVAAQSIVFNVSRFLGPAIAGVSIAAFGLWSAFAINAVSYFAMIAALLLLKLKPRPLADKSRHFLEDFKAGVAYTYTHPEISWQVLVVAISALTGRAAIVMLPAYAGGVFAGSSSVLATLTSVAGAGAVLAGIVLARLGAGHGLRRATVFGTIATGLLLIVLGVNDNFVTGILVIAVLGFCLTLVGIGSQTLIQTAVTEQMRGRVLSLWAAVAFSAPALGGLVIGLAAEIWGLGMTTVTAGVL
jgi:MFS family permease